MEIAILFNVSAGDGDFRGEARCLAIEVPSDTHACMVL